MPKDENLNSKDEFNGQTLRKIELAMKSPMNCKTCGKEFLRNDEMKAHFKKFHERLNCSECEYKSFGELDMKNHVNRKHVKQ